MARKKRRWIPWTIGGIVVILGLGYAVLAQTGIPHYYFAAREIYAKAKALGVPMSAEEYDPPREGENAGPEYVLLCQQVQETMFGPAAELDAEFGKLRLDGNDEAAIHKVLKTKANLYRPLIEQMEDLSKLPTYQIPRDYSDPNKVLFPELSAIKVLANEQANLAVFDAMDGRRERACERLTSIVRMSDQVRQSPTALEFIMASVIETFAISGARRCMVVDNAGARHYASAIKLSPDRERLMFRAIRNEAYFFVSMMRRYDLMNLHYTTDVDPPGPINDQTDGLPERVVNRAALAYGLEATMPVYALIAPNGQVVSRAAAKDVMKRVSALLAKESSGLRRHLEIPAAAYLNTTYGLPDRLTQSEAAKLCLDALAEWVTTGKQPTNLPIDPFSGAPVLTRVEGRTLIVYSVGQNEKDDGGRLRDYRDVTMYYTPGEWWR